MRGKGGEEGRFEIGVEGGGYGGGGREDGLKGVGKVDGSLW